LAWENESIHKFIYISKIDINSHEHICQQTCRKKGEIYDCAFIIYESYQIIAGEVPQIKEHPLDVLVVKNDPATLRCNVSGDNVQVIWYKDNQPVNIGNSRLVLPNGSLFLLRADHDLGTYHCTATNK
jgi:hypothetical protein